jgi:hypothetical protein
MSGEVIYVKAGKAIAIILGDDVYLTVVGVGVGIVLGSSCMSIYDYRERRRILRSPDIVIVKNDPKYRLFIRRVINQLGNHVVIQLNKSVSGREILTLYRHLAADLRIIETLKILRETCGKLIKMIIIGRSIIMVIGAVSFYLRTRDNLFIVAWNTLKLLAYSESRSVMLTSKFVAIVLLTARIWCVVPETQVILKVWVLISILNLSGQVSFYNSIRRNVPINTFGLPRIERPIPQLNYDPFNENVSNSKIKILKKEDQLDLSLPLHLQTESSKARVNNTELEPSKTIQNSTKEQDLEIAKIIQNSTLGEENIIVPKKQESQQPKISGSKSEKYSKLKPKKRINNLQNLKDTCDINSPLTLESEVEDFSNVYNEKKIKEGKVK